MIEIHEPWKALAVVTIETLEEIEKKSGRNKPLNQIILEFGQFLSLLAIVGWKFDKEGAESDDKTTESQGSG